VVPPTQVAASRITSSVVVGTEAPVPPLVDPQIEVSIAVIVHVVAHVKKRLAACAISGAQHARARRKRPKNLFFIILPHNVSEGT